LDTQSVARWVNIVAISDSTAPTLKVIAIFPYWRTFPIPMQVTGQVPAQNGEKVYPDKNHDEVFLHSFPVQLEMATNHNAAS
jgi:hypothetical protein